MKSIKLAAALGLGIALSACGASDVVTRDAPLSGATTIAPVAFAATPPADAAQQIAQRINVAQININVPRRLRVSEANIYYPLSDIVWRGDVMGDRYSQITAIFEDAFASGTAKFDGPVPVIVEAEIERFHSLTEKARYTTGGVHNIIFKLQLRDARTGALLSAPRRIEASLKGFGGSMAIAADARGETQKVRITQHLAGVIAQELVRPEGYTDAAAGFFAASGNI
ncbi:DUF6778 family protein [Sulfitobacter sp. HNIBRBA3233]|uniref:DUF6778 family protein n=1 Tax=Sulfitobacter marinivivus TaxID=3158558 RepID=UPI0032DEE12D